VRDEAAFLRAIHADPTFGLSGTDALYVSVGDQQCTNIGAPGVTRAQLVNYLFQTFNGRASGEVWVQAMEQHLCPQNHFAPAAPVAVPAPVAALAAPQVAPVALAPAAPINAHDWQLVAKDPAGHAGQRIIVYGNVTQFDTGTGTSAFRANVDGVAHKVRYGYVDYQTNTMLTGDVAALANVVQGDLFTAEVTVTGPYTYQTTMGGQMSAPLLNVTKLTVTGHIAH
jgi:hypothetical protein